MHHATWDQTIELQTKILREELRLAGVEISKDEAAYLTVLALRKYDRYDLFSPGETFLSRLISWLENFDQEDRQIAMDIVDSLKFVSQYEMKELAVATFENVRVLLGKNLSDLPKENWSIYVDSREQKVNDELSKSIFIACADDILFDYLRRYAMQQVDVFQKDNFVEYYKLEEGSRANLPPFERLYLIDQLSGSGMTAIRKENDEWKGKIPTFFEIWQNDLKNCDIYYCPFLQSSVSKRHLQRNLPKWSKETGINSLVNLLPTCSVSFSPCLSSDGGITINEDLPVAKLCRNEKYFSKFVDDRHIQRGGPAYYGFGRAGLTLILQSNCPNNTIPLIWHSYNGWFPLFPRVAHHR
jgi:hypothetical protein